MDEARANEPTPEPELDRPEDKVEDLQPAEQQQQQVKGGAIDSYMYFKSTGGTDDSYK